MYDIITQMTYVIGRNNGKFIEMLGTGFLISEGKYVVVPRHVIGDNDEGLCIILPSITSFNECQDTTINSCSFANMIIKYSDPFRDITILEFKDIQQTFHTLPIGGIDDISVGDDILIFGFPHCVEGRRVLTMQKAMVGSKILLNSSGVKSKYCVINTQTRPGQSGSMIYSVKHNKIVGILIGAFVSSDGISLGGINPRELHQTTQCLSTEYIRKMIGE
jgi:hypothetical protein